MYTADIETLPQYGSAEGGEPFERFRGLGTVQVITEQFLRASFLRVHASHSSQGALSLPGS